MFRHRCQMSECLAWDSPQCKAGAPQKTFDLYPGLLVSGTNTCIWSQFPPLAPCLTLRFLRPEAFFTRRSVGPSQLHAFQGLGPTLWQLRAQRRPEPTLPVAPQHQELSQQLNKVSFICDIQIQPMQKISFDSSDKLLKKKIYIKEFIFKVSSKKTIKG